MKYNKCIYCNQEQKEVDFSLEHIFPDSLGGKYTNDLFKTKQVCKKCNNLSGLYVDSLFVKNFLATRFTSLGDYIGYYDFNKKPYLPFAYMGFYEYVKHPNYKFCEAWQWSDGSVVYHFHNNSEDDFKRIAGGDPRKRKSNDAGEVYLVGLVFNQFWINLLLNSFFKQFKKSKHFFVNYTFNNEKKFLTKIQSKIQNELFLNHEKKKNLQYTVPMKLDFNIRFQAKLALGLGYTLFGEAFTESVEAKKLRDVFWNKDYEKLVKLDAKMLTFFSPKNEKLKEFTKYLNFKGCHGLFFLKIDNSLIFYGNLFGNTHYPILTLITNELDKYNCVLCTKYTRGWGYILVPQRELLIGAFDIGKLLAFNMGDKQFLPELEELELTYITKNKLPEFER